jgi:hypothetical protein
MEAQGEVGEDGGASSHQGKGCGGVLHRGCPSRGTDAAVSSIDKGREVGEEGSWGRTGRKKS